MLKPCCTGIIKVVVSNRYFAMSMRVLPVIAAMASVLVLGFHAAPLSAQSAFSPALLEQLSPADRQKALQALQGGGMQQSDAPEEPRSSSRNTANNRRMAPPALPAMETEDGELPLFGYALFAANANEFTPSAEVPIPQNYVLGPGDVVRVQLFGNQNETLNLSVTRDGAVNLPKLGPIQVAGLSIDDARAVIERRVSKELIGVQTNITLGPLRGVQVFLLGDARQPGAYSVSGLATITNALLAGGGVAPTGSLRKIELKRAGRVVQRIDLYDFLLRGDSSRDVRLQAGDAVFIPAVGPRISVAGAVNRPAVYEMLGTLTVKDALQLAGGMAPNARRAQVVLERIDASGQRQLQSLDLGEPTALATTLRNGDRLDISAVYERAGNPVSVVGHVRYPNSFAWSPQLMLSQVLAQADVRPSEPGLELYPALALIERTDPATGLRGWTGFDLAAVLAGQSDQAMQSQDRVAVFTRADIAYLLATEVRDALSGKLPAAVSEFDAAEATSEELLADRPEQRRLAQQAERRPVRAAASIGQPDSRSAGATTAGADDAASSQMQVQTQNGEAQKMPPVCPALLEVVKISDSARAIGIRVLLEAQASAAEQRFSQASKALAEKAKQPTACPEIFRDAPTALPHLLEHSAGLVGEVRQPGLYPFLAGTPLSRLTAIAGGETNEANAGEIEFFNVNETPAGGAANTFRRLQRSAALSAQPASRAIYRFLPSLALPEVGAVQIRGEVRFPGRYVMARGERYSDLLARAGGLNSEAFAYGTVFTRVSAREQEAQANRRAATDLRESLVNAATQGLSNQGSNATANTAVLDLVQRLETAPAVGRIVIEGDPAVLSSRAGADFLLEPGDEIVVPKRPNFVAVTGQVLSPTSLAFVNGADYEHYIRQAGGFAEAADDERVFVVLPNGEAKPLRRSFWQTSQAALPPGSVIVVPRDVAPFTALILTERITSILSNLALSAAALVTINR